MRPLIDANAFLGSWPFGVTPELGAKQLAEKLRRHGVRRAFVSDLGAVFAPDPMPANRALFAAVRDVRALVPVPILNPALTTWREQFEACRTAAAPLRAVRILPNYHIYTLTSRRLEPFVAALTEARVRLVLNVRLEDERHTYFALRIKGIPVAAIAAFLRRFSTQHVLCTGLYKPEIESLTTQADNFSADLSFAEAMDTAHALAEAVPASRLMFGSAAPLLSIAAQAAKIDASRLPAQELGRIASENARRFFSL